MIKKENKVSFINAARKILERIDEPMGAQEIINIAIESDLIKTEGQTPAATMAAVLYTNIKKKNSLFKKVGKGKFALKTQTHTASSPLLLIEQQNQLVSKKLKEKLQKMDPFQFEVLVGDLLQNIGYEDVEVTKRSGDKGIDVKANLTVGGLTNVKTVIQVKRYKDGNNISGKTITQLRGSAEVDQRGLVITTSNFTPDAVEESKAKNKMPVALVNGTKLIELMFNYQVGIKKEELLVYSLDLEYFENDSTGIRNAKLDSREKNRAIWPLPGGTMNYIETLQHFLEYVSKKENSREGHIKWFLKEFDTVSSENSASGYINVPKNMGLIKSVNKKYYLTPEGSTYLKSKNIEYLFEIISNNILAFDDIYEYLSNSEEPQTTQNILNFVVENFDVNWTSFAQINFRLLWLINLKKIKKIGSKYTV